MNKRKVLGVLVTIFGLVMVAGSAATYPSIAAPITMSFIVLFGLVLIFWDKVKTWMK